MSYARAYPDTAPTLADLAARAPVKRTVRKMAVNLLVVGTLLCFTGAFALAVIALVQA